MNKMKLIAVFLTAALTLSGCGIYTATAQSGVPKAPNVGLPDDPVSAAEEIRPDPSNAAPVGQEPVPPVPADPAPVEPKPVTPAPVKPDQPPVAARLTKAEAEAIALKHAGFTAEQVKGLRSEYDFDDGVSHYEVEFRVGQWEYDYDIHAESGKILSFEKDD